MKEPTFAELKEEFAACESEYVIARQEYNDALEALQAACKHETIVGGNEEYGDSDKRVCVTCGLYEIRGREGGDEYNYGFRTPFKKLPVKKPWKKDDAGTRAYKPDSDKDIWRWVKSKV